MGQPVSQKKHHLSGGEIRHFRHSISRKEEEEDVEEGFPISFNPLMRWRRRKFKIGLAVVRNNITLAPASWGRREILRELQKTLIIDDRMKFDWPMKEQLLGRKNYSGML